MSTTTPGRPTTFSLWSNDRSFMFVPPPVRPSYAMRLRAAVRRLRRRLARRLDGGRSL